MSVAAVLIGLKLGFYLLMYNTFKIQLNLEPRTAQRRKDPKTKRSKNELRLALR